MSKQGLPTRLHTTAVLYSIYTPPAPTLQTTAVRRPSCSHRAQFAGAAGPISSSSEALYREHSTVPSAREAVTPTRTMAFAPQIDDPELIAAPVDHVQRRLLDAGRIILTGGWLVLTYTVSNRAANAAHGLIGLALLLLGVFLTILSLVANQFPGVARAAAAVADAVLFYFLAPAN